jgi:hypothetical protein
VFPVLHCTIMLGAGAGHDVVHECPQLFDGAGASQFPLQSSRFGLPQVHDEFWHVSLPTQLFAHEPQC